MVGFDLRYGRNTNNNTSPTEFGLPFSTSHTKFGWTLNLAEAIILSLGLIVSDTIAFVSVSFYLA